MLGVEELGLVHKDAVHLALIGRSLEDISLGTDQDIGLLLQSGARTNEFNTETSVKLQKLK